MRKIHTLEHAHRLESIKWDMFNNWFGIISLIVAACIGAFGSICELKSNSLVSVITAVGGVLVAILAGIQTFLKPSEIAEKHRVRSITYEKLRHKIEYLLFFIKDSTQLDFQMDLIKNVWEQIDALNVSRKNFKKAKTWIKEMNKYPEELGFLDTIEPKA